MSADVIREVPQSYIKDISVVDKANRKELIFKHNNIYVSLTSVCDLKNGSILIPKYKLYFHPLYSTMILPFKSKINMRDTFEYEYVVFGYESKPLLSHLKLLFYIRYFAFG